VPRYYFFPQLFSFFQFLLLVLFGDAKIGFILNRKIYIEIIFTLLIEKIILVQMAHFQKDGLR
jgi:hypothetical protein